MHDLVRRPIASTRPPLNEAENAHHAKRDVDRVASTRPPLNEAENAAMSGDVDECHTSASTRPPLIEAENQPGASDRVAALHKLQRGRL